MDKISIERRDKERANTYYSIYDNELIKIIGGVCWMSSDRNRAGEENLIVPNAEIYIELKIFNAVIQIVTQPYCQGI